MPCTAKKTVSLMVEAGNDYVIALKANQKKLYEHIQAQQQQGRASECYCQHECSRDRQTQWRVCVFEDVGEFADLWAGLKRLVSVERSGRRGGQPYHQLSYYISSLQVSAEVFAQGIRGHWGIENRLHWVKDVVFGEDASRIRRGQAAANFSVVRSIVINLLRRGGYASVTQAWRWLANDLTLLCRLIE